MEAVRSIRNSSSVAPEAIFRYGLMVIAVLVMVAELHNLVEYFFAGLLVAWFGVKVHRRDFHFVRTPLDLPIVLFVVWIALTIPFSVDPGYSFAEWRKTVLQISMFYFVANVVNNETHVRHVLYAVMLGVIASGAFGIVDHLARGDSLFDRTSHAASLASSGQFFSTYLVMGVPFFWLLFQERAGRFAPWHVGFLFVMTVTALFLSHTRGAWVAFVAQLIVFGLLRVKRKWRTWGIVAVTCGALFVGGGLFKASQGHFPQLTQHVPHKSFLNFSNMQIRLDVWSAAIDQIAARSLLGYGYGKHTFQKKNEERHAGITVGFNKEPLVNFHVHNTWLSLVYETGLPGLTLLALVLVAIIRTAVQDVREGGETLVGNLGFCILLLVVGVVVRNVFDMMFLGGLAYLFWLLTGLYFALKYFDTCLTKN